MSDAGQFSGVLAGAGGDRGPGGRRRGRLGRARAGDAAAAPAFVAAPVSHARDHRRRPRTGAATARTTRTPRSARSTTKATSPGSTTRTKTERLRRAMRDGLFAPWTELGRAPTPAEFAQRLKLPPPDADRLLDELQACGESVGGGILRVPESELIAVAWPLSNVPTGITVTVAGGKPAFARCAIDALGVSALTAKRTVVEATARDNAAPLRVVVDGDRIVEARPAGVVVVRGKAATTCRSSPRRRRRRPGRKRTPAIDPDDAGRGGRARRARVLPGDGRTLSGGPRRAQLVGGSVK